MIFTFIYPLSFSIIVSMMNNIIESLDDNSISDDDNNLEKQKLITLIESELADMSAISR